MLILLTKVFLYKSNLGHNSIRSLRRRYNTKDYQITDKKWLITSMNFMAIITVFTFLSNYGSCRLVIKKKYLFYFVLYYFNDLFYFDFFLFSIFNYLIIYSFIGLFMSLFFGRGWGGVEKLNIKLFYQVRGTVLKITITS